jgi:FMN-dependent NADH-azoreductase
MKILHIDSSILSGASVSRGLTRDLVARLRARHPQATVAYRDLADGALGHLSGDHLAAAQGAVPESAAVRTDLAASNAALDEFLTADVVVIGAPMYNFAIPSQLKAWIDRIVVAGKTFRYSDKGPEGMAGGRKVIVVSSRGGLYGEGMPAAFLDHQETYLKAVLGFIGVTDLSFVRAEGLKVSDAQREAALRSAAQDIEALAA